MNSRHYLSVVLFLSFLFIHATIQADTLYLKDGSTIFGTVKQLEDELTFAPSFGDDITVAWDKVAGLSTDKAHSIELKSGKRVEGSFIYTPVRVPVPGSANTGTWQLKTSDGQVMKVGGDDVKMIWDAGKKDPKTLANETKWTVRLSAGLNGETGNNDRVNFNAAVDIKRTTPQNTLDIYGRARFSQENGSISSNELIGGAEFNWNVTKRMSVFVKEEVERDRFENINFRSTTTSGLGYKIIDKDKLKWKVQLGSGAVYEEQIGGIQTWDGVIDMSETLMWQWSPYLEFNHKIEFYPELEDFGDEYRAIMENGVLIPLAADKSWRIRLGLRHAYNKNPGGGAEKLDTFYYANVVWDVK